MKKRLSNLPSAIYIFLCFAFFYLPILITVIFSFNSSKSLTHFTGFSFKWYKELLHDSNIMSAVSVSVTIAILSTIISTILGTITAIGLSKSRKILRELVLSVNDIPVMNPDIVTAILGCIGKKMSKKDLKRIQDKETGGYDPQIQAAWN